MRCNTIRVLDYGNVTVHVSGVVCADLLIQRRAQHSLAHALPTERQPASLAHRRPLVPLRSTLEDPIPAP